MAKTIILEAVDITGLLNAQAMLDQAIAIAKTDLEKTGAIKTFEYCYELSWKTMKRILAHKGIEVMSPRDVFREAARNGLIADPEVWFDFIRRRNLTAHTYGMALAEEVFDFLPEFQKELHVLTKKIQGL